MKHYKPSGGKTKKRLLALVLAAALVCSSLMPVYANDVALMDDDFSVMAMDEMPAAVTVDDSLDLATGINESVDEFGNVVITWGSDTWTDWTQASDDQLIASPYPDGEQMDPGFAIPTVTYRFWLSQKDKTELAAFNAEVESGVKLYGMTKAEYIDLYGPNDGMFSAIHVADGGSLWDNSFKNPTASDAPDAGKTVFAGWYTLDEHGYEQKFTFDADCKEEHVSEGVVYASKMATVDVFAKWSTAVTDQAEQPKTNPDYDDTLDDHTYDKWYAALVSSSDSAFNDLIDRYLEDEGFEAWLNNLPEDEIQYLIERMDSFVETLDEAKTDTHSLPIAQGESETVAVSGMTQGLTCTDGLPSGITVEQTKNTYSGSYTGYKVSVGSNVKAGSYKFTLQYKYTVTSSNWPWSTTTTTTYDVTDTVTVTVTEAAAHFTVINNMVNTEVAYIDFKPSQSTSTTLTPVENGVAVKGSGSSGDGVLVFFIKPKDGYLLTEFVNAAGTACDLYSVTVDAGNSMINYFQNNSVAAQKVLDEAKKPEQGYLGYYGFTYSGSTYSPATYSTKAERPQMTVTAVADKTTGVKPGDIVTYTVTITPGHTSTGVDKVTGVTIGSLTVNGEKAEYESLTPNEDGTYTMIVKHEVTQADWASGDVKLKVAASVNYSYTIRVNDRKDHYSDIPTTAEVPNEAEVSVQVAPKTRVVYSVTYDPNNLTPPDSIKTVPVDAGTYFKGDTVNVNGTYGTANPASGEPADKVLDSVNGGTWTFDGWYKDEALTQKASATEEMPENGLFLYGKWRFVETTTTVTIAKKVTGFFGERNKDFQFTISFAEGTDTNNITAKKGETLLDSWNIFTLKNGESVVLSGVPIGAQITVTETNADDYDVSAKVGNEPLKKVEGSNAFTYTTVNANNNADLNKIVVTNHKTADVDAGVDLGSATPYLFLLCVGAVGVATLRRKRRS